MESLLRQRTQAHDASEAERATALTIVGLLLAITTPFLLPTALGALFVSGMLARAGRWPYAVLVLGTTAIALAVTVAALVS
jgi:hypothetical protein